MNTRILRAFMAVGALATSCATWGCVADRPARNGVYNENQYIRKDFLIRPGTNGAVDDGWFLKETVISESIPNPLAAADISDGITNVSFVRFVVTQDKLNMVNMRELTPGYPAQGSRDSEVVDAWPITNVDLKYRVNLDGETTNFYEENQELDWQVRQWVKVNLDKNDLSDMAPLGAFQPFLNQCTDTANSSTTLVPGSFNVDEPNNYMTWQVQITTPILFTDSACTNMYGEIGQLFETFGRTNVTFTVLFSMVRAAPDSGIWTPSRVKADGSLSPTTYPMWALAEKDPIRKKYGVIENIAWNRDPNTGLLAAQELLWRNNPNEPLVWYFAQGYPAEEETMWTRPGGILDQTNQIFSDAGATIRLSVLRYNDLNKLGDGGRADNPIQYGDVRYNMIRWISDYDIQNSGGNTLAATYTTFDPRTGEPVATTISVFDWNIREAVLTRLDFYLQSIGAEQQFDAAGNWPVPPTGAACQVGDTYPLAGLDFSVGGTVQTQHNEISTVYDKMQLYLHKPSTTYGYLNPSDFIPAQSQDFINAIFRILPYEVFRDPATNAFVIPEGGKGYYAPEAELAAYAQRAQLDAMMAQIDQGYSPYEANTTLDYVPVSPTGESTPGYVGDGGDGDFAAAQAFTDNMKQLWLAMNDQQYLSNILRPTRQTADGDTGILTNFTVFAKDARQCVSNDPINDPLGTKGAAWETRDQYVSSLVETYHDLTVWHEFGHSLGLEHNFMGSVDKANFPYWTPPAGTNNPGPRIGEYSSSLMDYNQAPDRIFWTGGASLTQQNSTLNTKTWGPSGKFNGLPGWAPYDVAAITWIYANGQKAAQTVPNGASNPASVGGQFSATKPWVDPHGFDASGNEISFLYCTNQDVKFSPFCRTFDFGTTPSEIVASAIDNYELEYKWRNFRLYNKFWDDGPYAESVMGTFYDLRRFLSTWAYDWSQGELIEDFPKVGIQNPTTGPNASPLIAYYGNLAQAFTNDISVANQLVAAFHKAIIQQSSGERPYVTIYDPFYGDVVQQGIIIDKITALQNWTSLFKIDNYDPTQSAGAYMFAATPFDTNYQSVAEDALDSMIGGEYDIFPYASPLSIQMFAEASHDINFTGRIETRDWIGGKSFGGYEIDPNQPFVDFFHNLAAVNNAESIDPVVFANCTPTMALDACAWDPRVAQINANDVYHSDPYNEFRGPDGRRYAWASVADRNSIVIVDRDRNTASYVVVRNYNQDVVTSQDDGSNGAYSYELPIKYTIDSFDKYN